MFYLATNTACARKKRPLLPCPAPGEGVHRWIFSTACEMRRRGYSEEAIGDYLETHATRPPQPREISEALRNSAAEVPTPNAGRSVWLAPPRRPKWPNPDGDLIRQAEAEGIGLADLWEASCHRFDDSTTPRDVLGCLFAQEDLICASAVAKAAGKTRSLSKWGERLNACRFVVPSPMVALEGVTQSGRRSPRTLSNVGARRYLVVEFDGVACLDRQAARIAYLARRGPLVMVLHSGGKSLHAWFRAAGASENTLRIFFDLACRLGADPATWTRSQFVRIPEAVREDNGRRQSTIFFNPRGKR